MIHVEFIERAKREIDQIFERVAAAKSSEEVERILQLDKNALYQKLKRQEIRK